MSRAVVLLSGGLDSVVSLASIKEQCSEVFALMFNYGQKSFLAEKKAVELISKYYSIDYKVIDLDWLAQISTSALTSEKNVPIVDKRDLNNVNVLQNASSSVWIPNRNALFINIAASFSEALGYNKIIIGANKEESQTFKDNSKEFIISINNSLKNSVNTQVEVIAPLIDMTKEEIVSLAIKLNVPFDYIYSCYLNNEKHCGMCESCQRFKRALELNNKQDVIEKIFIRK